MDVARRVTSALKAKQYSNQLFQEIDSFFKSDRVAIIYFSSVTNLVNLLVQQIKEEENVEYKIDMLKCAQRGLLCLENTTGISKKLSRFDIEKIWFNLTRRLLECDQIKAALWTVDHIQQLLAYQQFGSNTSHSSPEPQVDMPSDFKSIAIGTLGNKAEALLKSGSSNLKRFYNFPQTECLSWFKFYQQHSSYNNTDLSPLCDNLYRLFFRASSIATKSGFNENLDGLKPSLAFKLKGLILYSRCASSRHYSYVLSQLLGVGVQHMNYYGGKSITEVLRFYLAFWAAFKKETSFFNYIFSNITPEFLNWLEHFLSISKKSRNFSIALDIVQQSISFSKVNCNNTILHFHNLFESFCQFYKASCKLQQHLLEMSKDKSLNNSEYFDDSIKSLEKALALVKDGFPKLSLSTSTDSLSQANNSKSYTVLLKCTKEIYNITAFIMDYCIKKPYIKLNSQSKEELIFKTLCNWQLKFFETGFEWDHMLQKSNSNAKFITISRASLESAEILARFCLNDKLDDNKATKAVRQLDRGLNVIGKGKIDASILSSAGTTFYNLSLHFHNSKEHSSAIPLLKKACKVLERALSLSSLDKQFNIRTKLSTAFSVLSHSLTKINVFEEALKYAQDALFYDKHWYTESLDLQDNSWLEKLASQFANVKYHYLTSGLCDEQDFLQISLFPPLKEFLSSDQPNILSLVGIALEAELHAYQNLEDLYFSKNNVQPEQLKTWQRQQDILIDIMLSQVYVPEDRFSHERGRVLGEKARLSLNSDHTSSGSQYCDEAIATLSTSNTITSQDEIAIMQVTKGILQLQDCLHQWDKSIFQNGIQLWQVGRKVPDAFLKNIKEDLEKFRNIISGSWKTSFRTLSEALMTWESLFKIEYNHEMFNTIKHEATQEFMLSHSCSQDNFQSLENSLKHVCLLANIFFFFGDFHAHMRTQALALHMLNTSPHFSANKTELFRVKLSIALSFIKLGFSGTASEILASLPTGRLLEENNNNSETRNLELYCQLVHSQISLESGQQDACSILETLREIEDEIRKNKITKSGREWYLLAYCKLLTTKSNLIRGEPWEAIENAFTCLHVSLEAFSSNKHEVTNHTFTMKSLISVDSDDGLKLSNLEDYQLVSEAVQSVGQVYEAVGWVRQAELFYEQSLHLAQYTLNFYPQTSYILILLSELFKRKSMPEESFKMLKFSQALEIEMQDTFVLSQDSTIWHSYRWAKRLVQFGDIYRRTNRMDQAESIYSGSLAEIDRIIDISTEDSLSSSCKLLRSEIISKQGRILRMRKKDSESLAKIKQSLAVINSVPGSPLQEAALTQHMIESHRRTLLNSQKEFNDNPALKLWSLCHQFQHNINSKTHVDLLQQSQSRTRTRTRTRTRIRAKTSHSKTATAQLILGKARNLGEKAVNRLNATTVVPHVVKNVYTSAVNCLGRSDPFLSAYYLNMGLGVTLRHVSHSVDSWQALKPSILPNADNKSDYIRSFIQQLPNDLCVSTISIDSDLSGIYIVKLQKTMEAPVIIRKEIEYTVEQLLAIVDSLADGVEELEESAAELTNTITVTASEKGKEFDVISAIIPLMAEFEKIMKENDETLFGSKKVTQDSTSSERHKWWRCRKKIDRRLALLTRFFEEALLGQWKSILYPELSNPVIIQDHIIPKVDALTESLQTSVERDSWTIDKSLVRIVLNSFGSMSSEDRSQAIGDLLGFSHEDDLHHQNIQRHVTEFQESYDSLSLHEDIGGATRQHTVLILDKKLQRLPWECTQILSNSSVSRMPSLPFLEQYLSRLHSRSGRYCRVDTDNTFYLLSPSGDCKNTVKTFKPIFDDNTLWKGLVNTHPSQEQFKSALEDYELFIFMGHGSGDQYLSGSQIQRLKRCATTILMGCSSGALTENGDHYEPSGMALNYIVAGCPCVVANLWDVTDKDIDRFSEALLDDWMLDSENKSLTAVVGPARKQCRFEYLVGAAPVCYGLPVYRKSPM